MSKIGNLFLKTSYGVDEIKELPIMIKNILGN